MTSVTLERNYPNQQPQPVKSSPTARERNIESVANRVFWSQDLTPPREFDTVRTSLIPGVCPKGVDYDQWVYQLCAAYDGDFHVEDVPGKPGYKLITNGEITVYCAKPVDSIKSITNCKLVAKAVDAVFRSRIIGALAVAALVFSTLMLIAAFLNPIGLGIILGVSLGLGLAYLLSRNNYSILTENCKDLTGVDKVKGLLKGIKDQLCFEIGALFRHSYSYSLMSVNRDNKEWVSLSAQPSWHIREAAGLANPLHIAKTHGTVLCVQEDWEKENRGVALPVSPEEWLDMGVNFISYKSPVHTGINPETLLTISRITAIHKDQGLYIHSKDGSGRSWQIEEADNVVNNGVHWIDSGIEAAHIRKGVTGYKPEKQKAISEVQRLVEIEEIMDLVSREQFKETISEEESFQILTILRTSQTLGAAISKIKKAIPAVNKTNLEYQIRQILIKWMRNNPITCIPKVNKKGVETYKLKQNNYWK